MLVFFFYYNSTNCAVQCRIVICALFNYLFIYLFVFDLIFVYTCTVSDYQYIDDSFKKYLVVTCVIHGWLVLICIYNTLTA